MMIVASIPFPVFADGDDIETITVTASRQKKAN